MTTTTVYKRIESLSKPKKIVPVECWKCNGSGIFRWGMITNGVSQYSGTCFRCGGLGADPRSKDWGFPISWSDEQVEEFLVNEEVKRERAKERREAKKQAERDAAWLDNVDRFPRLIEIAESGVETLPSFATDILVKAHRYSISEKQGASVVEAYDRHLEWLAQAPGREAARAAAAWLGEVGDKVEAQAVVTMTRVCENQFGLSMLVLLESDGDVIKTFGTARWLWDVCEGDEVTIKGTIKSLDEYKGVKQTNLTRTKGEIIKSKEEG